MTASKKPEPLIEVADDKMLNANERAIALLRWLKDDVFIPGAVLSLVVRVPNSPGSELYYTTEENLLNARAALISMAHCTNALERICLEHARPGQAPILTSPSAPELMQ